MSTDSVKQAKSKFFSPVLATGLFLLVLSLAVVVLESSNYLAIGMAFFVLMIGIALVMMGALGDDQMSKRNHTAVQREITREIVKVRCSHCGQLNLETNSRCSNCGAIL